MYREGERHVLKENFLSHKGKTKTKTKSLQGTGRDVKK